MQPLQAPAPVNNPRSPCARCGARGFSVCSAIPEADLARLAAAAVTCDYVKGETFIAEGEPAAAFFNMTQGTAKLFKLLPDGRQQNIGFARCGSFLGLAVGLNYAFSAEAIEPVRACRFDRRKLHELVEDFPQLEQRLLQTACTELVTAQEQIVLLGRKTAQERVASFLLSWSQTEPCRTADRLRLPMTRGDIADHLGLRIETVSRVISRLRAERRIATPTLSEVTILDRPWLEAVAAGSA